jgi:hypothetical protein
MKYKGVVGGTKAGENLCDDCMHAHRIQGEAESQKFTVCSQLPRGVDVLQIKIIECNKHRSRKDYVALNQMDELAWSFIVVNRKTGARRLVPPGVQCRLRNEEEELTEEKTDEIIREEMAKAKTTTSSVADPMEVLN